MDSIGTHYISSLRQFFIYQKNMAEKAIAQLPDPDRMHHQDSPDVNSIAILIHHIGALLISRFTNVFEEDGEKSWRNREQEFEARVLSQDELWKKWNDGWSLLEAFMNRIVSNDLGRIVYIRNEGYTVLEALQQQLMHNALHIGQILHMAKKESAANWQSLTIPKGQTEAFNKAMFSKEKSRKFPSE